jgi:hypothetical protein
MTWLLNNTKAWKRTLSLQAVLHAPAAGAERDVGGRQYSLGLAVLSHLGNSVDDTTDETNKYSRHTAEGNGCIEEDESTESDRELVQGSDHRVGCRRGDTNSPGGGVGDEDSGHAGDDHDGNDGVALLRWEVLLNVRGGPVLDKDRGDEQDGDSEEVVVVHSYPALVLILNVKMGHLLS